MRGKMETGRIGEDIAACYLRLAGYEIVERNFRFGHLEVDVVARSERCMLFVEVKTRRGREFGEAAYAVDSYKIKNMKKAAMIYMSGAEKGMFSEEFRIDLVTIDVDLGKGRLVLEHLRGIA